MLDRRVGSSTARFAVLGEHLGHTWSPYIHNSLFAAAGRDAIYLPITVPPAALSSAADVLRSCFCGFNVTIPYKEQIIPLLDELHESARACGAVNTVVNRDGRLTGYNTDGTGMLRALEEGGVQTASVNALILGGGGAARAAGYAILSRGGRVTFAVRDAEKGERLAQSLSGSQEDGRTRIAVCAIDRIADAYDLLIQCTSVGMTPRSNACPVGEEVIARCAAVFDAVYNPRMTRLLQCAARLGIPTVEGLGMLYYQAVEAERIWFGGTGVGASTERAVFLELCSQL